MKLKKVTVGITSKKHPLYRKVFPKSFSLDEVQQSEAKQYLPPDTSIWRSNTRSAWCFHNLGHVRRSVTFAEYGGDSRKAMREALKQCWRTYNDDHGLDIEWSPIDGLFPGKGD